MARIYAGILGSMAFLTCLARGLVHAWPAQQALLVGWTNLLAFAVLGAIIGWIAEWLIEDELRGRMAAGSDVAKPQAPAQAAPQALAR